MYNELTVHLYIAIWLSSYAKLLQSCLTLCGTLAGFSRQEYWSGLPFPSLGDLLDPGIKPGYPALQADALPSEPPGERKVAFNQNTWKFLKEIREAISESSPSPTVCSLVNFWFFFVFYLVLHCLFTRLLKGKPGKLSSHLLLIFHFYFFDL